MKTLSQVMTLTILVLMMSGAAIAETETMRGAFCQLYSGSGGWGTAEVTTYNSAETGAQARSVWILARGPELPMQFTRALNEIGAIPLNEVVTQITYKGTPNHCQWGVSALDVTCLQNLAQLSVVTQRRDQQKRIHERQFALEVGSLELQSSKYNDETMWYWGFSAGNLTASTGLLNLTGCMYGDYVWP